MYCFEGSLDSFVDIIGWCCVVLAWYKKLAGYKLVLERDINKKFYFKDCVHAEKD